MTVVLLAAPLIVLAGFFFYPLARTFEAAFAGADAWAWLTSPYVQGRLTVAVEQAVWSVILTLALALPLAWLHHTYRIPWSRTHLAVHAAPFVLPVFVVVFGIQQVLGPNGFVHDLTGVDALGAVGPLGAVVIAHAYYNYGFAARLVHTTLTRRPHRLEEAAHVLGASRRGAFWRVTVPLLLPSLAAVALLVFLFAFTSFGVVLFMGAGKVSTLETLLYQNLGGIFPRFDRAAVLGITQLAINVALLAGYLALRRRSLRLPRARHRLPAPPRRRHVAAAWLVLAVGLLPAAAVLVGGFRVAGEWSLEAWRALLDPTHPGHVAHFDLVRALDRSLFYAVTSMLLSLGLTVLLAYGISSSRSWWRRGIEVVGAIPLGTSSVLLGFGYVLAFGAGAALDLRGTRTAIVIAHALVAFPFTARVLLPALEEHDPRLDEAASLLGAPPLDVVGRIHWPLLKPAVLAAAGFAVAISLGDFGASLILMRSDTMALSVWIGRHDQPFDPLMKAQATALAGVLMVLAAGAYILVERFRIPGEGEL